MYFLIKKNCIHLVSHNNSYAVEIFYKMLNLLSENLILIISVSNCVINNYIL